MLEIKRDTYSRTEIRDGWNKTVTWETAGHITANRRESTINPSERGFGASNALWRERGTDDKVDERSVS